MATEIGRVPDGTGLSQVEPQEGLARSGFDPSRITALLEGVDAKLLEPIVKKAADEFYCTMLETTQDYLLENLDYNLKSHVAMMESENQHMRSRLWEIDSALGGASNLLAAIQSLQAMAHRYEELLFAVSRKHEGESRHETALRYIQARDRGFASTSDSDGSPKGGDACGSVHDSAGPKDIAPDTLSTGAHPNAD